jgi:glycosyltransferase involved in cell wall biosynthesis
MGHSNMKLQFSVIICTYNRVLFLEDCLLSLLNQGVDDSFDFEVIVVDNNSKDKTKDIVLSYKERFCDKLEYILETEQGLSYARNRGVRESKREIVIFTDDDVVVDKCWLKEIYLAFAQRGSDIVFGKISPSWQIDEVPSWLRQDKELWKMVGVLDYGDTVREVISKKEQFFGANFAIKRSVLEEIGGFDTGLGVKGSQHSLGEDTDLFFKAFALHKKITYNPAAHVYHKIGPAMMTKAYIERWSYWGGVYSASRFQKAKNKFVGAPYWFIKEFLSFLIKYFAILLGRDRHKCFR